MHDAHSHGASSLCQGAMEGFSPLDFPNRRKGGEPITVETGFDPREAALPALGRAW